MNQLAEGLNARDQPGDQIVPAEHVAKHFDHAFPKGRGARLARTIDGGGRAGHGDHGNESFSGGSGKTRNPRKRFAWYDTWWAKRIGNRQKSKPPACPARPAIPVSYTPEQNFERARQAFRKCDYDRVLHYVDRAIEQLPGEADLFQMRSLILFAQGEYPLSAEAAYTALSAGPGRNWNTLYRIDGDAERYTRHLRALETATKANLDSAAHHFLLEILPPNA